MPPDDELTRQLAMLIEGECQGLGPLRAARKFRFSKQRYFQLRQALHQGGALAPQSKKQRWHAEEFFNAHQALGWKGAGTLNLNIRYGHMTLALLAQTVVSQLRYRLGEPAGGWDAAHLAQAIFQGLEGDVRVSGETILVTYYNAPHPDRLRDRYEHLPVRFARENLDPRIPWRYNFKLDFRFR